MKMMQRRRTSSDDVQIVSEDSSSSFVDLTQESPAGTSRLGQQTRAASRLFSPSASEIVDLTCGDTPPVILEPVRSSRRSRRIRQSRLNSPYSSSSDITIDTDSEDDNEMDVQLVSPVNVTSALPWRELPDDVSAADEMESPGRKQVICPVCMDNETQIRANGLQLTSTICGHIFCNRCIRGAIQTQHRCPACRNKLTMRQIHPIFL